MKKIITSICLFFTLLALPMVKAETTNQTAEEFRSELKEMGINPEIEYENSFRLFACIEYFREENRLFFYVYNSTEHQNIKSIRMSVNDQKNELCDIRMSIQFKNYFKFELTLKSDILKAENLYEIMYFNQHFSNGEKKAISVAESYYFFTEFGKRKYIKQQIEVILIQDFFVGYYPDVAMDVGVVYDAVDYHFVAFTPKYPIDQLYEVEIEYERRDVFLIDSWIPLVKDKVTYKNQRTDKTTVLSDESITSNYAPWKKIYSWNRITRITKDQKHIPDAAKDFQFYINFLETDHDYSPSPFGETYHNYTEILFASIIRMKFEVAGIIYDLSAVCDTKISVEVAPPVVTGLTLADVGYLIIFCVVVIVLLIIMGKLKIFKGIRWLIKLPFSMIKKLFKLIFKTEKE